MSTHTRAADAKHLASPTARIFTVPPGKPFLDCLARAILSGDLAPGIGVSNPLGLADITLLLPTRRATRALQDAFLKHAGTRALIVPRIRAIADGEDELTLLSGLAGLSTLATDDADARPAISPLERRLILTKLVLAWSESMRATPAGADGDLEPYAAAGGATPAQAAHLAAELARLMDMVETENASLADLANLVPETYSEHWQRTLEFLEIVTQFWPAHLDEYGLASPMASRNLTLARETRRLIENPPRAPVIVAGVTGSIPATSELMRAVARLPNGYIVLPGLDLSLDDASWEQIRPAATGDHAAARLQRPVGAEHPQHGLKVLLDRLGATRADVTTLPGAEPEQTAADRLRFVAEAMRPATTTAEWHTYAHSVDRERLTAALAGIDLIDAPSAQDEAEAIALILREALETPGRTAALVSPDRLLARRVAARLATWGIRVDDSAGKPFAKTVPGAFLDLVIEAVDKRFAPAELIALLKHPLTRLGLGAFEVRRAARALELAAFRTDYLGIGIDGVEASLEQAAADVLNGERRERPVRRLRDDDWTQARELVQRLRAAFAPLSRLYSTRDKHTLAELAAAHIAAAEAVARLPDTEIKSDSADPERAALAELYAGDAGTAAIMLFEGFIDPSLPSLSVAAADYADLYRSLIATENIRPRIPLHPRLFVWGPFEARLQQPDVVVLGSLNDGIWPEAADPGPWLNRPMRRALGLPAPEERIGYAAHDFTSMLGAEKVYLTRAEKIDGVPTVPSRWLMRIVALLDGMKMRHAIAMDRPWLAWARLRDAIPAPGHRPIEPPMPRPPVEWRPRKLSVSAVETWLANPYAIFAGRILGLDALPQLGKSPDASLKGAIVHDILADFTARWPRTLPDDIAAELMRLAHARLAPYLGNPRIAAFWLPRLERFAHWFADTEPARRAGFDHVVAEIKGETVLDLPGGPFTLTARADRIDIAAGKIAITDYKTGKPPSAAKVREGNAPQLSLEAAIAIAGGFTGVAAADVSELRYIHVTGGTPPGEDSCPVAGDVADVAAVQRRGLEILIDRFDDPATAYDARRRPGFSYVFDDFAHLARIAEWSGQGLDTDADDGEP